MRNNKFSSAADRRWQRRYERIQQRKEAELIRDDLVQNQGYICHDTTIQDELARISDSIRHIVYEDLDNYYEDPQQFDWCVSRGSGKSALARLCEKLYAAQDYGICDDRENISAGDPGIIDSFLEDFLE